MTAAWSITVHSDIKAAIMVETTTRNSDCEYDLEVPTNRMFEWVCFKFVLVDWQIKSYVWYCK